MNFKHMFVSAIARRLAYVIVVALLAWIGIGKAHAAGPGVYATQTEAYSECISWGIGTPRYECNEVSGQLKFQSRWDTNGGGNWSYLGDFAWTTGCPAETPFDPATGTCAQDCSAKTPLTNVSVSGDGGACKDGCAFVVDLQETKWRVTGVGTANVRTWADKLFPSGDQCTTGDTPSKPYSPDKDVCSSTGGSHTECVKPNGDHCVTGAKGSRLCWSPSQTGDRAVADGSYAANRVVAPGTPAAPANIESPTTVATTTTTINGTTYNTITVTGTGNTGGQTNTGTGGQTGNGTGTSDGTGQGTDEGDGDGEEDGVGAPGAGVGELYEGTGKTAATVFSTFKTRIEAAPIAEAGIGFFTVSGSGGCPTWTVPATDWYDAMTFDFHCSGPINQAFQLMGFVLLAVAAYAAWKIGFG